MTKAVLRQDKILKELDLVMSAPRNETITRTGTHRTGRTSQLTLQLKNSANFTNISASIGIQKVLSVYQRLLERVHALTYD